VLSYNYHPSAFLGISLAQAEFIRAQDMLSYVHNLGRLGMISESFGEHERLEEEESRNRFIPMVFYIM